MERRKEKSAGRKELRGRGRIYCIGWSHDSSYTARNETEKGVNMRRKMNACKNE